MKINPSEYFTKLHISSRFISAVVKFLATLAMQARLWWR